MSNQLLYWVLLAVSAAYVFWGGGSPERLAMLAWAIASILSTVAVVSGLGSYERLQSGVLVVDLVLLAFLVWLSIRSDRYWPLWMTGFHLLGVMTHLAKAMAPGLHPWAYAVGQAIGGYLIIATMVIGTRRHRKRLACHGADASWSSSSIPSHRANPPTGRAG